MRSFSSNRIRKSVFNRCVSIPASQSMVLCMASSQYEWSTVQCLYREALPVTLGCIISAGICCMANHKYDPSNTKNSWDHDPSSEFFLLGSDQHPSWRCGPGQAGPLAFGFLVTSARVVKPCIRQAETARLRNPGNSEVPGCEIPRHLKATGSNPDFQPGILGHAWGCLDPELPTVRPQV